jgi:hypothetical protein
LGEDERFCIDEVKAYFILSSRDWPQPVGGIEKGNDLTSDCHREQNETIFSYEKSFLD